MDRDKVIKGLECCHVNVSCEGCPYDGVEYCLDTVMHDALALLKEQEKGLPQ